MDAENAETVLFGVPVSDIQSNVTVDGGSVTIDDPDPDNSGYISGTLKYLDDTNGGDIVDVWGEGNFIALKFTINDPSVTSVMVGLEPSQGSGLVEIINDPDKNGVFKITDKDSQVFKVVQTDGTRTRIKTYDLSGLELETNE